MEARTRESYEEQLKSAVLKYENAVKNLTPRDREYLENGGECHSPIMQFAQVCYNEMAVLQLSQLPTVCYKKRIP